MLVAVSADGSYRKPMAIIQRKTYEIELSDVGLTPESVMIVHREHGFIDRVLFELWAATVLFPEIERRHTHVGYAGDAIVILDGCTCHDPIVSPTSRWQNAWSCIGSRRIRPIGCSGSISACWA
jgi:hypothetical protein